MKLPYYEIDAFTNSAFGGNPAGVCLLEEWLADDKLQSLAAENNFAETAFVVPRGAFYDLRWFTPKMEMDLCGHATLASAFVIFNFLGSSSNSIEFKTKSGSLMVKREEDLITLNFPSRKAKPCPVPDELLEGLSHPPSEVLLSRDYLAVYPSEEDIRKLAPTMDPFMKLNSLGVIVTSPGSKVDFVSRFFAPKAGIPEDPVTGSAHCTLIPYWAEKLGKQKLHALQLSSRGGELFCEQRGDRVAISGRAVRYLEGFVYL